jgi:hypothetical protein
MLSSWRVELEITFLPVYQPASQELADPKVYAVNVAKASPFLVAR